MWNHVAEAKERESLGNVVSCRQKEDFNCSLSAHQLPNLFNRCMSCDKGASHLAQSLS